MKKTTFFLMLTLIMMSTASVNAQVTIGSMEDPHGGAVLDLSKATGNSIGLLLSHISLDNVYTWQIGGDKDLGVGMVVYNTNINVSGGKGIGVYVWNGNVWEPVKFSIEDICPHLINDVEGNTYSTGWFGAAGCWMTQNLRSTKNNVYIDLEANTNAGSDASLKYYWYPNNDPSILEDHLKYGLSYTWAAAGGRTEAGTDSDGIGITPGQMQYQGICPNGWHLPSDYEWNQLEEEIAKSTAGMYSTTAATAWEAAYSIASDRWRGAHGQKMKSAIAVNSQVTNGTSKSRTVNGFDALLVGGMYSGSADYYGSLARFWSSSSLSSSSAGRRYLYDYNTGVFRDDGNKCNMWSVRCKKND
jgi:uncharacterized protein (TIGR02145 family)